MTLTNDLCVIKCLPCIILHVCTKKEISARKRFKDIPLARKCNQEVTDWLTFFCKKQYAPSFYRSRFKYGIRSVNTQHFHSYCSCKNVLFMGQSDLDPRTIDLYLNVTIPVWILYKYEYVAQVKRPKLRDNNSMS